MADLVILNLAETGEFGTPAKVEEVLQEKERQKVEKSKTQVAVPKKKTGFMGVFEKQTYQMVPSYQGNTIVKYNLVEEFDASVNDNRFGIAAQTFTKIQLDCQNAKKIYICAHGAKDEVDKVFAVSKVNHPPEEIATSQQLADFLKLAMADSSKTYKLTMIICYAARAARHDQDHEDAAFLSNVNNLKSSFAYRVFKRLGCTHHYKIRMVAATGQVVAKPQQGFYNILVQTERGIVIEDEINRLKLAQDEAAKQAYDNALKRIADPARQMDLTNLPKDKLIPPPQNHDEIVIRQYIERAQELRRLTTERQTEDKPKYGKLLYEMPGHRLRISLRYTGEVLFEGDWL